MTEELSTLVREALKMAKIDYNQLGMSIDELAGDLIWNGGAFSKFTIEEVIAELKKQTGYTLEEEMSAALQKLTGQELIDFSVRVRENGILAMIDIITVDQSQHTDFKEQSKKKIASFKEIIADSLAFVGQCKIARNQ